MCLYFFDEQFIRRSSFTLIFVTIKPLHNEIYIIDVLGRRVYGQLYIVDEFAAERI